MQPCPSQEQKANAQKEKSNPGGNFRSPRLLQPLKSRRPAGGWRRGFGATGATAGPVTVRLPSDVAHFTQRNSCSSPAGSTSNSRSRTGCDAWHFGQYSSLAVKFPNCCGIYLLNVRQVAENIKQHFVGCLIGVDTVDQLFAVVFEDRFSFALVSLQPVTDHVDVGVVQAVFFERTALKSTHQILN